jgi:hypothetical protein
VAKGDRFVMGGWNRLWLVAGGLDWIHRAWQGQRCGDPVVRYCAARLDIDCFTSCYEGAIMRYALLAFPASLLLLACPVHAQTQANPQNYPPPDGTAIETVQVTAPFRLTDEDADKIGGTYAMSNGWHLKVEQSTRGMQARIDNRRPIRLIAITADKFVSRDGNVTMDFNRGADGDEMLMTYVPDQRVAIRYVVGATVAQR